MLCGFYPTVLLLLSTSIVSLRKFVFGVGLRATAQRDGRLIAPHEGSKTYASDKNNSDVHLAISQRLDLSME